MNKTNKKVAKFIEKNYNLKAFKNQWIDISQFPEYEQTAGQNVFVKISQQGKITDMAIKGKEEIEKESYNKGIDEEYNKLLVKEKAKTKLKKDMTRKELNTLKEDPDELSIKLDKAYLAYDEANALVENAVEGTAEERVARTKKRIAMKKLYDTATASGSITGEDEKGKAFQYVSGKSIEEGITEGSLPVKEGGYRTKKDPRRAKDVLKSLDTPSSTLGVLQKPTDIKKLSDEELIKRLQLGK